MKKLVITVTGAAVIAWIAWSILRPPIHGRGRAGALVPTSATIGRGTIEVIVEAIGEINPANQVTVKAEVGGRVKETAVRTGQHVTRGTLLISLDDTDLLTERDAALTDIAGARFELDKAQRDFDRLSDLFASELVSREAFDNARTALQLSSNVFLRAEKSLQGVEDKLKKIRIDAPFDGTVLSILVSEGQVVSGAAGVNQGTDLMTFADLNQMMIRAHINQVEIINIQPDHEVEIMVDSLPETTLEGRVVLIAPIATVKDKIKGFNVDVLITRNDPRVRPGMNANLTFPVILLEDVLTVPVAAVFTEGEETVVYLETAEDPAPARRVVEIGPSDFQQAQILAGLAEGDTVRLQKPGGEP